MTATEIADLYLQDEGAADAVYGPCPEDLLLEELVSGVTE